MCLGSWLSFGRLNRVLGLDAACVLPSHYQQTWLADEVSRLADRPRRPASRPSRWPRRPRPRPARPSRSRRVTPQAPSTSRDRPPSTTASGRLVVKVAFDERGRQARRLRQRRAAWRRQGVACLGTAPTRRCRTCRSPPTGCRPPPPRTRTDPSRTDRRGRSGAAGRARCRRAPRRPVERTSAASRLRSPSARWWSRRRRWGSAVAALLDRRCGHRRAAVVGSSSSPPQAVTPASTTSARVAAAAAARRCPSRQGRRDRPVRSLPGRGSGSPDRIAA